jgi:hypothetical protein
MTTKTGWRWVVMACSSNGQRADIVVVAAKMDPKDTVIGDKRVLHRRTYLRRILSSDCATEWDRRTTVPLCAIQRSVGLDASRAHRKLRIGH